MKIFKKIGTVLGSALLVGASMGMAAAGSFPVPFVEAGTADAAVVTGTDAAPSDWIASTKVYADISSNVVSGGSGTSVEGTAWQVATSSDKLEIGECIKNVETYITDEELPILVDGTISNEKGTAKYEQFLYFEDVSTQGVNYTEDDDENVGLFLKIASGNQIARYLLDFTSVLESDVISGSRAEDIEDKSINFLGKEYTIIVAENKTNTATDCDQELTLMSGADKATIGNDEEVTVGGKIISVVVSSATQAQFTIDGESSSKLNEGDTYRLPDDTFLGVSDITYQDYSGGIQQATFYIGADKIELKNGSSMVVNAETITDAAVEIECTMSGGDISISEIKVNMSAADDFFVPVDGKLSEVIEGLAEDENVLITNNWDIEFKGLASHKTEDIKLYTTGSDERVELKFNNYDGDTLTLPLFFMNKTATGKVEGLYSGEKVTKRLVAGVNSSTQNITGLNATKGDLFLLHTANPRTASLNARTYVVEYKGSTKSTVDNAKVTIRVMGETSDRELALAAAGTWSVRLGGTTFNFANVTSANVKNHIFALAGALDYTTRIAVAANYGNSSMDFYLRTQYNALINITDGGQGYNTTWGAGTGGEVMTPQLGAWSVNISVDDTNKDGDTLNLAAKQQILWVNYTNQTDATDAEVRTKTVKTTTLWITDPDDNDVQTYQTTYGAYIKKTDTSSAPAQFEITIPESIVEPLIYVSSGDITVTTGTGEVGGLVTVKDTELTATDNTKNLVVVGGSCINTVAAKLLGSTTPICEAAFTTKTGVGAGEFLIESFASPYDATQVALLVAGYNAADTTKAVTALLNSNVDTSVGTKYVSQSTTVSDTDIVTA